MASALPGGFAGVDVFFVLSGFLITSIILHDLRNRSFSLREFYLRRIQRLLPNATLTIFVTILLWVIVLTPSSTVKAARHGLATLFSLSNFYLVRSVGGYWGDAAASYPLLHTWSLAVEEQFYLLFPTLLLLVVRRRPARTHILLGLLILMSFGLTILLSESYPSATAY
jgi:peptidoglycan/LPS O-acetylase OafA/YrhL